jgi:hypothetical protein
LIGDFNELLKSGNNGGVPFLRDVLPGSSSVHVEAETEKLGLKFYRMIEIGTIVVLTHGYA